MGEPITEATGVNAGKGRTLEIILENEEKCSEKMKRDPPYNKSGTDTEDHRQLLFYVNVIST